MAQQTNDLLSTDGDPCGSPQRLPVNVYETEHAVVVVTPMPAVMADDLHVSLEGRTLTIRAECRTQAPSKRYLVHEWHYGPYERTIDLPEGFGGDTEASFANGQLALSIGRGTGASGRRELAVTAKH